MQEEWKKMLNDYGKYAENALRGFVVTKQDGKTELKTITTSQLRNIMAQASLIYQKHKFDKNDVVNLRIKIVYQIGRDDKGIFRSFNVKTHILEFLDFVNDESSFNKYYNYLEAIVAYHKYYGGKE